MLYETRDREEEERSTRESAHTHTRTHTHTHRVPFCLIYIDIRNKWRPKRETWVTECHEVSMQPLNPSIFSPLNNRPHLSKQWNHRLRMDQVMLNTAPSHHSTISAPPNAIPVTSSAPFSQNLVYAIFSRYNRLSRPFCFELLFYHFYDRVKCHACAQTRPTRQNQTFFMFDIKVPFFMQRNPDLIIFGQSQRGSRVRAE